MRRKLAVFTATAALVALALPGIVAAANTQVVAGRAISGLGTLMVATSNQMTLYTFDKDVAGSGISTCTGGCLTNWPALVVAAGDTPTGGPGVTGPLGTIVRTDNGATQVTYNGLPLYYYIKDVAPGDTTGIYTNWRAIVLAAAAPAPTPAPTQPPAAVTPPPTTSAPVGGGPSTPGDPILFLMTTFGAVGFVLAIRRFASRRAS
jgi:predicted lipoprotein with Yx(FWY)xxD motif